LTFASAPQIASALADLAREVWALAPSALGVPLGPR
jgi:hypothetical protein